MIFDDATKAVINLIQKLFQKTRASRRIEDANKKEIFDMLEDAVTRASAGTEKIDEQIANLKEIQKQIDIKAGLTPVDDILDDLSRKTGADPEEVRKALINKANEGYSLDSPKRMKINDDDTLRAYVESRLQMGEETELIDDILQTAQPPAKFREFMKSEERTGILSEIDDALKFNKQRQKDLQALEEKMADIKNFKTMTEPGGLEKLMREVQDDKVVDLAKFRKAKDPVDDLATGGRVGFNEGGNDDKKGITRRGFIKGAGALGLLGLVPGLMKGKAGIKAAQTATKIEKVAGMPDWFPMLVNKIRKMGKVTREPDYKDFTSGGDLDRVTELKVGKDKYLLYENQQSGNIVVTGRGNESQQVSMEYLPGETMAVKNKDGKMGYVTDKPSFEAGEYAKGEFQDFENVGVSFDDLRGDISNWENFAKGGSKVDVEKAVDDFIKSEVNPNITEGFAQGGGVGTLFKRRAR